MRSNTLVGQNTLSEQIFQKLKEGIISGEIAQGEKIKEINLAKLYDTSRGPLREALHRLEHLNLVNRTPHSGSRVITLTYQMMCEVYQMREAMEGFSARLACATMSQNEIDQLYRLLDSHEASIKQSKGKVYFQQEGDLDFHYYIYSKCQNQWLIDYLNDRLYQILRMCRRQTSQIPFRSELALQEHYRIADALSSRDAEFAEILMRRHIKGAWQTIQTMLSEQKNACSNNF